MNKDAVEGLIFLVGCAEAVVGGEVIDEPTGAVKFHQLAHREQASGIFKEMGSPQDTD